VSVADWESRPASEASNALFNLHGLVTVLDTYTSMA